MAVILAQRFGGTPMQYWHADAADREQLLEMLAVENEVAEVYRDIDPDDEVIFADDD